MTIGSPRSHLLPPAIGKLMRAGEVISQCCQYLAALSLIMIVIICGVNVVQRYLFGIAWSWAEEAMLQLMVVIVFMGVVSVSWRGKHLRLEAIVEFFPERFRMIVAYLSAFLMTAFLTVMTAISFQVVGLLYSFDQRSNALEIPLWIPQSVVGLGFALIAVMTLLRLIVFGAAADLSAHADVGGAT